MSFDLYQVDAFTERPFGGNPAAVCLLAAARPDEWMQSVAREMNLSETAFLHPLQDPAKPGYSLRWFTPAIEVELCGHATLASAHVLYESSRLAPEETARFHTLSGLLTAEHKGPEIELDFPAKRVEEVAPPDGLLEAFGGVTPRFVGKSRFDYLLELDSEERIVTAAPDMAALKTLPVRGIIITAPGESADPARGRHDFVSRFFAPGVGVDEDPVTGSAHCSLGPYWAHRLGKSRFLAYQASARGGTLRVEVEGERVKLGGRAVTVMYGKLLA